ncbi:MAG: MOSC domain-containing protein [Pseudomonadota bacterium]
MAQVIAVASDAAHRFSKRVVEKIDLVAGLGVAGDAHAGVTVRHRSRVARNPGQPNLRQVHLLQAELFDEVATAGFALRPRVLGKNVTTRGLDLLSLPRCARLALGADAVVEVTGLRNPCAQIDAFQPGLLGAVVFRVGNRVVRGAGSMGIVLESGTVAPGDAITVVLPDHSGEPLTPV